MAAGRVTLHHVEEAFLSEQVRRTLHGGIRNCPSQQHHQEQFLDFHSRTSHHMSLQKIAAVPNHLMDLRLCCNDQHQRNHTSDSR